MPFLVLTEVPLDGIVTGEPGVEDVAGAVPVIDVLDSVMTTVELWWTVTRVVLLWPLYDHVVLAIDVVAGRIPDGLSEGLQVI